MDFLKKTSQIAISKYIPIPLEIVTSVIIIRWLGVSNYGIYNIAFMVPIIIISIGSFGFGPAVIYYYNKRKLQISEIFTTLLIIGLLLGLAYYSFTYFLLDIIQQHFLKEKVSNDLMVIALLLIPILLIQKYIRNILRATYRIKEYAILVHLLPNVVRFILVLIMLVVFNLGLKGLFWVTIITESIVIIGIIVALSSDLFSGYSDGIRVLDIKDIRDIFIFGIKGHLGGTIQKTNDQLATMFMTFFLSTTDIGYYTLASRIVNAAGGIKSSIGTVLSTKISKSNLSEISIYFPYLTRLLFSISIIIGIIIVLILPFLVPLLYGPTFKPVVHIGMILTPGIMLFPIVLMIMVMFSQTGKPLMKAAIRSVGFVINAILLIILLKPLGPIGAALAATSSNLIIFVIALILANRYINIPISDLVIIKNQDIKKLIVEFKKLFHSIKHKM